MKRALLPILTIALMGCAGGITKDGLFVAVGDSQAAKTEAGTDAQGGQISESLANLLEGIAGMIPGANSNPPDVTIVVPDRGDEEPTPEQ